MALKNYISRRANDILTTILRSHDRTFVHELLGADDDTIDATERHIPIDPEKLEYLRRLIAYILDGRDIAALFNYVVLAVLAVFTLIHWQRKFCNARRRESLTKLVEDVPVKKIHRSKKPYSNGKCSIDEDSSGDVSSSSASSTIVGTRSPAEVVKSEDVDLERQPLLNSRTKTTEATRSPLRFGSSVRSWLMYQPRPLPIINRSLPSNGTTLFVLGYIGVNIFLQLYGGSLRPEYEFAFADRAGYIFIVNLPLLYLLAAKNQPVKFLTGYSYEALNIFHRRVGEWMCFIAFVHSLGMVLNELYFEAEWLKAGDSWYFFTHPLVLLGIGAFLCYELLYFTSLGSFRQRWYELFLASHIVLQVGALVFLYFHFHTAKPYVLASLVIFVADRLVWRLLLKSTTLQVDLQVLEDGKTFMLSADWDLPQQRLQQRGRWFGNNITYGWRPMDHIFITAPSLGCTHKLQAHPFTIASAAPEVSDTSGTGSTHAWLNLLIRAHDGFTGDLLQHARLNSTISLRVDGPYGSPDALEMLLATDTAVLVAGGSGIAVVFPVVWELVHKYARSHPDRRIHLLWIIRSHSHRSWMPQERLDDLARAGVYVTIPEPTANAERPDVDAYISDLALGASNPAATMGVVVSGPDALNRTARNACAGAVKLGKKVDLRVEKFGW